MNSAAAAGHRAGTTRPRARRRWSLWFFGAIVLLAAAYTGLWFYAVTRAGHEIDAFMAREAKKGRMWTCSDRHFSGYPLQIALGCRTLGYKRDEAGAAGLTLSAGAFEAIVALYDPNRVTATLEGPLDVHSGDGTTVKATWDGLRADLRGLMTPDRATLTLKQPQAQVDAAQVKSSAGASELRLQVRVLDARDAKVPAAEVRIELVGLAAPMLDDAVGNQTPADVNVGAFLSDVLALRGPSGRDALESWRAVGGNLEIAEATFAKGPAHVGIKGLLGFDDAHRAQGNLSVGFDGMEGVLKRFNVPVSALSVGNALAGLLGGPASASPAATPATTTLPLTLANGRVSIGPIRLPVKLKPLY